MGAYSRPTEAGDSYTSLFIYGAVFGPIGRSKTHDRNRLPIGYQLTRNTPDHAALAENHSLGFSWTYIVLVILRLGRVVTLNQRVQGSSP